MKKKKSHQKWSWIIMILFITLSIVDIRFGLFGIVCITVPMYHALRGRGKIHCSHYCPRGSLLGKFLKQISLENNLPKGMKSKTFKTILLLIMIGMFSFSMFHTWGNINKMAFAIFRFMMVSLTIGVIMGVVFRPRSWCQVCPMGYGTELITKSIKKKK